MINTDQRREALRKATEIVGGQTAMARALSIGQSRVSNWLNRDQQGAPAEFCIAIETLTEGAVTRYQLRPDIFGDPSRAAA